MQRLDDAVAELALKLSEEDLKALAEACKPSPVLENLL
jgi:hypothetical protein